MGQTRKRRIKKEEVLDAIRAATTACEGRLLNMQKFQLHIEVIALRDVIAQKANSESLH